MSHSDYFKIAREICRGYVRSQSHEYDRLRGLANREYRLRGECFEQAKYEYFYGDRAEAKRLSEQGKEHGRNMDEYNLKASKFVFFTNNAYCTGFGVDLHGLFVNGETVCRKPKV